MSWRDALDAQRNYFKEYGQEIAKRNLKLMNTVCYVGIIFYVVYFIITTLFFSSKGISLFYGMVVPVLCIFALEIRKILRKEELSFRRTQVLTLLMYIFVMGYVVIMSTVPHPELQAVYYPLFLLLGPAMFLLPVYQQVIVNVFSFGAFYTGVVLLKPKLLWSHDLFEGFTALIFSVIMILLMTQLRVQGEHLKDQYYQLSRKDGLTGLLNKTIGTKLAKDYVENEIQKEIFALVILDIDDFKHVNDTYGHEKGDEILSYLGYVLEHAFRKDDIVCRYGGDEFMILMKQINRENAEKKIADLEQSIKQIDSDVNFTCSIGVCMGQCGKKGFEAVVKSADDLMYQVKNNGKNDYIFLD